MLQELTTIEEKFQAHLKPGHYTFIGPDDDALLKPFVTQINNLVPVISVIPNIHRALSHRDSVLKAIETLPRNTPLRIYVVTPVYNHKLLHNSIESYCRINNIDFQ